MNELVRTPPPPDCFGEPNDDRSGGEFAKFDAATPQKLWHGRDGEASTPGPYIAVNCIIEIIRWNDKKVVDRIVQKSGEPLPDVDALNNAIPREDWEEDPFTGDPRGPWVKNYTVHLVNPGTGEKLSVSNSTTGQKIAWQNLKERVAFMRNFRGELVYPEVLLSSKSMKTHYAFKARPDFEIVGWRNFGGSPAPVLAPPSDKPGGTVPPLTADEIVQDEIPDHPAPKDATIGKVKKPSARPASMPKDPDDPLPF
jgi:hypothetical protein